MTAKKPTAPAGLGVAGAALWRRITAAYELDPGERALLEAACRQADDIRRLEKLIERDGLTITGSRGQPRLNAAVTEVRQGRIALQKLLAALALPSSSDDVVSLATARSNQARRAAVARWKRGGS